MIRSSGRCNTELDKVLGYAVILGKSRKSLLLQFEVDMGTVKKPTNESDKATLALVKKEMAKPRIAKSARQDA
jgi:hypothetical protein